MVQASAAEPEIENICFEHVWSNIYSHLWWREKLSNPGTLPNITPDDITRYIGEHQSGMATWASTAQRVEMARYRAMHESLVKEIEAAGVVEIWYNLKDEESDVLS